MVSLAIKSDQAKIQRIIFTNTDLTFIFMTKLDVPIGNYRQQLWGSFMDQSITESSDGYLNITRTATREDVDTVKLDT